MKKQRAKRVLSQSTSDLEELIRLQDETIIRDCLPSCKPFKPSELDKVISRAIMIVLSGLHSLQLELVQKENQINGLREYSKAKLADKKRLNKKVIDPKTITIDRSIELFDKRLQFVRSLFSEILVMYEMQTGKKWVDKGSAK